MDYIQSKLLKAIEKTKKRQSGRYSTIVGYYNVLIQYQLYLMFACVWDKREPELSRSKKIEYLKSNETSNIRYNTFCYYGIRFLWGTNTSCK